MDLKVILQGVSDEAVDLLSRMLEVEPSQRISAYKALKHLFFEVLMTAD
jgi:serine/threonine protein kinase